MCYQSISYVLLSSLPSCPQDKEARYVEVVDNLRWLLLKGRQILGCDGVFFVSCCCQKAVRQTCRKHFGDFSTIFRIYVVYLMLWHWRDVSCHFVSHSKILSLMAKEIFQILWQDISPFVGPLVPLVISGWTVSEDLACVLRHLSLIDSSDSPRMQHLPNSGRLA